MLAEVEVEVEDLEEVEREVEVEVEGEGEGGTAVDTSARRCSVDTSARIDESIM